jgi:lipopolysaccharide transport system permease protein
VHSSEAPEIPAARRGPGKVRRALELVTPPGSARLILSHWRLLWRVTRTEMSSRFAGSFLGAGWVILAPGLILTIYAAIYLTVFKARVPTLSSQAYVVFLLTGLVPYLATAEALSLGVTSVVANKSVLSNTVFPIDLAPVKAVITAQATMVVGMIAAVVGVIITHKVSPLIVFLPVVWFLQVLALIGLTWILSLLNVIVRDLQNALGAVLMILLIASPIFYTPDQVPHALKLLLALNPLAYFIVAYQEVVVLGFVPSLGHIIGVVVLSLGLFFGGSIFFARAKLVLIDYV